MVWAVWTDPRWNTIKDRSLQKGRISLGQGRHSIGTWSKSVLSPIQPSLRSWKSTSVACLRQQNKQACLGSPDARWIRDPFVRPCKRYQKVHRFWGGQALSLSLSRQQLTHPAPVFGSNSAEPGGLELEPLALPGPHSASMPTYILACPCQRSTCTPCSTQPSHHTRGADQ